MPASRYGKDRIGNHMLHPETLMLGYGYDPALSEGRGEAAGVPDLDLRLQERRGGPRLLRLCGGRRTPPAGDAAGLVYSRFNHPNSEIVEERLAAYEGLRRA